MSLFSRKFPPTSADLPVGKVISAALSNRPTDVCLKEIGDYLAVKNLLSVNTGRAALCAILNAMLAKGSKVILPVYTCYTVIASVVRAGMVPILSDNDTYDLGYDLAKLKRTVEQHPDAGAIVVCHLFGIPVEIDEIRRIVGPGTLIIDDAAQAFGIRTGNGYLGTTGDVGFYSFGRGKNLSLVGGGLIVTDNDEMTQKIQKVIADEFSAYRGSGLRLLKAATYNFVIRPTIFNMVSRLPGVHLGRNVYDPGFSIAHESPLGIRLLNRLDKTVEEQNRQRLEISRQYEALLITNDSISIPKSRVDGIPGSLRFPVLVQDHAKRENIINRAAELGLGLSTMYPTALNGISQHHNSSAFDLEGAEQIASSIITLPTHRHIQSYNKKSRIVEQIVELFT
jgi:dTDP-4-amino-4,6-dideoxygalactose transaminase